MISKDYQVLEEDYQETIFDIILNASHDGDLMELEEMISEGHLAEKHEGGWTPLMEAVEKGDFLVCRIILDDMDNLDEKYSHTDTKGELKEFTALSLAIFQNKIDIAKLILRAGADPQCEYVHITPREKFVQNCLLVAMDRRDAALVDEILGAAFDLNQEMSNGINPLMYAVMDARIEWVERLVRWGADPAYSLDLDLIGKESVVFHAIELYLRNEYEGYLEAVKILVKAGGMQTFTYQDGSSVLEKVAAHGDYKIKSIFGLNPFDFDEKEKSANSTDTPNINLRSLLPLTSTNYLPPSTEDVRAVFEYTLNSGRRDIFFLLNERTMDAALNGDAPIDYPDWHLLTQIALEKELSIL